MTLRYPGYSFNYQMENELHDVEPIAKCGGIVTSWSDGKKLPRLAWKTKEMRTHAVRGITLPRKERLIPEIADHILGFAFGYERECDKQAHKKRKLS